MPVLDYNYFMRNNHKGRKKSFNYISLFSGAGIGEYGLKLAGGHCIASCELDSHRRNVHQRNICSDKIFSNVITDKLEIISHVKSYETDINLLLASPPCQSFSTANSKRGKRDDPEHSSKDARNALFFEALDIAIAVRPQIIIFENVPNFPNKSVHNRIGTKTDSVINFMRAILCEYTGKHFPVCFSDFGIPQRRKRSIIVFIRNDLNEYFSLFESLENKFGVKIKNKPTILKDVLIDLEKLDASSIKTSISQTDSLHQIPVNDEVRYKWISHIPPNSCKTAWENACETCGDDKTPMFQVVCENCGNPMTNRPHVNEDGQIRPIKGFKTSYKRMNPNEVAPTITTNSNSFSSDMKIHPYENRVLSVREVALLQTIPYSFIWTEEQFFHSKHLIREMIGEAIPPLFTYQLGLALRSLFCS